MRIGIGTSIVGQQVFKKLYVDDIAGTPTAAYSVDKVVSTYTDAVVEVRRTVSAVTVEADVAFDGDTITLDSAVTITSGSSSATTLGEFVAASGYTDVDSLGSAQDAFVATWYDQAGSNDATQTTAANQPKIVNAGGLVTENGKVALDFNSQFLTVPSSTGQFNYLHDGTSSSVFLTATAGKVANPNAIYGYLGNTAASSSKIGNAIYYDDRDGASRNNASGISVVKGVSGDSVVFLFVDDKITPQSQTLITSFIDADNATASNRVKFGIDGGALYGNNTDTNAPVSTSASHDFQIGAVGNDVAPLVGYFQELIIYNSDKSALRTAIEGNINGRFNIYT